MKWYEKILVQLAIISFCLAFMGIAFGEERGEETWETIVNSNYVNDMVFQGDYLWVATGGVVRWDMRDGTYIKYIDELPDLSVNAIILDRDGVLWFGTDGGVSRFDGTIWKTYTVKDGLAGNRVTSIYQAWDGAMWFGTEGGGVSKFDGTTWKTYTVKDGLADDTVGSILQARDGAMWFGTGFISKSLGIWEINNRGVSRFDGITWKTYTVKDGLAHNWVECILQDQDGVLWFGTFGGVSKLILKAQPKAVTTLPPAPIPTIPIEPSPTPLPPSPQPSTEETLPPSPSSITTIPTTIAPTLPPTPPSSTNSLIIVAGGGAAKTNTLWETTQNMANFIYKVFWKRGYTHPDVYYINPVSWQDFNGDGIDDHIVDAPKAGDKNPTIADLEYAITEWATKRGPSSEPLYIYMANHGGKESFRISPGEEINARTLDSFLDKYQSATGNSVVLIIEACKSGSFVSILSDRNRVIITSAAYEEGGKDDRRNLAFYDLDGRLSFTQFFAGAIVQGHSLKKCFDMAVERLKGSNKPFNTQEPWIDDDGDGKANGPLDGLAADKIFVGGTFLIGDVAPEVLEQSRDMSISAGAPVTFFTKVSDVEGMKNVWATVTPPDFVIPAGVKDFETPIIQLPSFSLSDEDGNSVWEGSYSNFALNGEYFITIYARDKGDNITMSSPIKVTVIGGVDVQPVPPREGGPVPPPQPSQASIKAIVGSDVYRVGDTIEIDVKATGSGTYDQYLALVLPPGDTFICLKAANRVGGVNELAAFKKDYVPDGLTHRVLSLPILTPIPAGTYSFYAIMVPSGADLLTTPMEGWIYDRVDFRFGD